VRRQPAFGITAEFEVDGHRMTFRMEPERFGPGQSALDRALEEMGGERSLPLIRHVLFATEGPTV